MKKTILLAASVLILILSLVSCKLLDDIDSTDEINPNPLPIENNEDLNSDVLIVPERNGISFPEEDDGAEIEKIRAIPSEYYGIWEATSDKSDYLYGGIEVHINQDGTWSAIITDENLHGNWEDFGDHLHMSGDYFSFDVAFEKSGKLLLIETNSNDVLNTVLTRKQ